MEISSSLSLEQKQQLKLNTKMLQSLQLMTLPLTELQTTIKEALETNPTLLLESSVHQTSLESLYEKDSDYLSSSGYEARDRYNQWIENTLTREESLSEHLLFQLGCTKTDRETKAVAEILITNLNKNGFHSTDPKSLIKEDMLPYLDNALTLIQSFDPIGVGVSDYKESLILQAKALGIKGDDETAFTNLVNNGLEKMRAGKKAEVAKDLNIEMEDLDALYEFLKTLTPYPGLKYSNDFDEYIIPDLSIRKENDKLVLKINTSSLPLLSIDPQYRLMEEDLKENRKENKETLNYLKEQLNQANDLINQIELRNSTLEKVGVVLLDKQKDFFLYGPRFIHPLILKDVAEIVQVHETTISRITTSKYIDTDFGIIPIKQLFSTAVISSDSNADLSKNAVKEIIKQLIEENSEKSLSDQKISDILSQRGIKLARRTVNKYRKELDIDSSFVRG